MSQLIRVNQTGYAINLPQRVTVLTAEPVSLLDEKGQTLRVYGSRDLRPDEASGENTAALELGIAATGTYYLASGEERQKLTVQAAPWRDVTNALIKGLYYQRCDELLEEHAGVYKHPACHTGLAEEWRKPDPPIPEDVRAQIPPHFLKMLEIPPEEPYGEAPAPRRIKGGWHDAGDYGKYVGPGAVTVAHLLYAWKLFPQGCSDDLNIPETGNGVPDILNETRFELEWMLQMQRGDGAFYHKLTSDHFPPFIMPEDDTQQEYLSPISRTATADAVAALALAYRVYRPYDAEFADRCLSTALFGWKWLTEHPERRPYRNPFELQSGFYGDGEDHDERFWAACELYAATGETAYREAAEGFYREVRKLTQFGWAEVSGLGALCCLFDLKENGGELLVDDLKQAFLRRSEWALLVVKASGYGTAIPANDYVWGSILTSMSNAMAMIMNTLLTGREDMRDAALLQLDYALGLNAMDISFITGYGERQVMFPHHRPSEADGIEAPVPGLISGGPNNKMNFPTVKDRLGDIPAAKSFIDETDFADMNEIAIYWNSPTIFTAAYFHSLCVKND